MVKILFAGDVAGNWSVLIERVRDLQNSRHGPFDVLFLTGKCFRSADDVMALKAWEMPLQTYSIDNSQLLNGSADGLPANFEVLSMQNGAGILNLHRNLTVGYMVTKLNSNSSKAALELDIEKVKRVAAGPGFRGCDVLISDEWPRGMHHFLRDSELKELKDTTIGLSTGNQSVSDYAVLVKPRYHVVSGTGAFFQRSPYSNASASSTGGTVAFTRLIAIAQVSSSKDKAKKWMHAVSISPIIHMTSAELADRPPGLTECPYVEVGTATATTGGGQKHGITGIGIEPNAKRIRPLPLTGAPAPLAVATSAAGGGAFFFGHMGVPRNDSIAGAPPGSRTGRGGAGGGGSVNLTAPSETACTLFIGGLLRETREFDLKRSLPGAAFVRRPQGKSYAFVDFESHDAARKVVESAARRGLVVDGRTLTVGWSNKGRSEDAQGGCSHGNNSSSGSFVVASTVGGGAVGAQAEVEYERILVPPSEDAKTLFVGGLPAEFRDTFIRSIRRRLDTTTDGTVDGDGDVDQEGSDLGAEAESSESKEEEGDESMMGAEVAETSILDIPSATRLQSDAAEGDATADATSGKPLPPLPPGVPPSSSKPAPPPYPPQPPQTPHPPRSQTALERELRRLLPGVSHMHKVAGKPYMFVEFAGYAEAMAVITQSLQQPIRLRGKPLTIGWSKEDSLYKESSADGGDGSGRGPLGGRAGKGVLLMTEPPSETSKVLFVGNLAPEVTESDLLSVFSQHPVESVKRPEGRGYAFVEFQSPEAARGAMQRHRDTYPLGHPGQQTHGDASAAAAGGGIGVGADLVLYGKAVRVGWAKGRAADKSSHSADCWFCLASPVVKVHLVVSVGENCYLALPRGGIVERHVLISPIECVPSRVHLSTVARKELLRFQDRVEDMFYKAGVSSLRFERALRTKGSRDHMQFHMVPLNLAAVKNPLTEFMRITSARNLKFREIQGEEPIDEVVVNMDGGPYQEYFYVEIPVSGPTSTTTTTNNNTTTTTSTAEEEGKGSDTGVATSSRPGNNSSSVSGEKSRYRRFVYVQEEAVDGASQQQQKFPMQFGTELVAEVLGQPERGHWKRCLRPEEEEQQLADNIRDLFAPHDFTL